MLILVYIILALQSLVIISLLALVARRIISKYWKGYIKSRENRFESYILGLPYASYDLSPLSQQVHRRLERGLIGELLLHQAAELKGRERAHTATVFEKLGYTDREQKNLKSRSWWRRRDAAIKLGIMRSKQTVPALIEAMHDPVDVVKLEVVSTLGQLKSPRSLSPLFDMLENSENWTIGAMLDVLSSFGKLVKGEALRRISSASKPRIKLLLVQLCGMMQWIEAIPLLIPLISNPDVEIRISTVRTMGSIGDPIAEAHLISALQDTCWEVRAQAAKSLGLLQDAGALKQLAAALDDGHWWVRYNAAKALWQTGTRGINELNQIAARGSEPKSHIAAQVLAEGNLGL